jgi:membrane-bound ClpP family serine protease
MCHIILSFPFLALPLFYFLPFRTALPIYLLIVLVIGFVYFKLVIAMKYKVRTGKEGMMGEEVLVIEDINPEGKVEVWSEIWSATANDKKFQKGQKVKVCGFDRLKVIVGDSAHC